MDAKGLYFEDGKSANRWFCGKCGIIRSSQDVAEQCCKPNICECGAECRPHWLVCDRCRVRNRQKKDFKKFLAAEKIPEKEWDGFVYTDDIEYQDGYFRDVEELRDFVTSDDDCVEMPDYVWCCRPIYFARLDFLGICDSMEGWDEFDPMSDLAGIEDFKKAIEAFNETNKNVCSYTPDYRKAIITSPQMQLLINTMK